MRIDGWMEEDELEWIAEMASVSHSILEVGAFKGRTTRAIADNTDGKIVVVDPWNQDYWYEDGRKFEVDFNVLPEFADNLEDHLKSGKVIPFQEMFSEHKDPGPFDFIFLDGDHRFKTVEDDIKHALTICHGVLAGHDYTTTDIWPGVKKAVDELLGSKVSLGPGSIWSKIWNPSNL